VYKRGDMEDIVNEHKKGSAKKGEMYSKTKFPSIEGRKKNPGGYRKSSSKERGGINKGLIYPGSSLISWCAAYSTGQSGWPNASSKHATGSNGLGLD